MSSKPYAFQRRDGGWDAFYSTTVPTEPTHGGTYIQAIGPFPTLADATFYVDNTLYLSPVSILPSQVKELRLKAAEQAQRDIIEEAEKQGYIQAMADAVAIGEQMIAENIGKRAHSERWGTTAEQLDAECWNVRRYQDYIRKLPLLPKDINEKEAGQ